jgi:hypothetical protein
MEVVITLGDPTTKLVWAVQPETSVTTQVYDPAARPLKTPVLLEIAPTLKLYGGF